MKFALLILLAVSTIAAQKDLDLLLRLLLPSNTRITGRINVQDKSWEEWQKRTGEMPPDFSKMRSQPLLPDPLEGVHLIADWRGEHAREFYRRYPNWSLLGKMVADTRAAAPRRLLLIAPELDRYADTPAIRKMVQGMEHVSLEAPEDFSRVPESTRKIAFDWLDRAH